MDREYPVDHRVGGAWLTSGPAVLFMDKFKYTFPISEANIQAEFYHQCRLLGVPCVLEFITPVGRHDACIFSPDFTHLRAIVECKNNRCGMFNPASRQYQRYKSLGVPIYDLCSMDKALELAALIKTIYCDRYSKPGRLVSEIQALPKQYRSGRNKRRPKRVAYIDIDEDLIIRT